MTYQTKSNTPITVSRFRRQYRLFEGVCQALQEKYLKSQDLALTDRLWH